MSIYQDLRTKWLRLGISHGYGTSSAAISTFEQKHDIILPHCLKEYLLTVNGFDEGHVDEDLFYFLSLDAMDRDLNSKKGSEEYLDLTIADYSLGLHWYVSRISRGHDRSPILAANGEIERKVAD